MENRVTVCPRNVLTHLQQLREWQKNQQQSLKDMQQENWKQLHQGKEKLQQLLDPILYQGTSPINEDKSENMKTVVPSKTTNKCPSAAVQHVTKETLLRKAKSSEDIPAVNGDSEVTFKKPFPFLKKGNGLVKYKNFARSTPSNKRFPSKPSLSHDQERQTYQESVKKLKFKRVTFQEREEIPRSSENDISSLEVKSSESESDKTLEIVPSSNTCHLQTEKDAEELVEFEILEQVTHNCSLDSDSSLVNHLLSTRINVQDKQQVPQVYQIERTKTEPEIRYPTQQQVSNLIRSEVALHEVSDTSISSTEDVVESSEEPNLLVPDLNKNEKEFQFGDQVQWKDDSILEWSASSPTDASSDDETHKEFSNALQDARKELLKISEQGPDKERLLLQERLKELEDEIGAFRKENSFLSKLKAQHKQMAKDFEKEKTLFKKKQEEDEKKLNEMLKEEKKKLKNQQQVFEKHWKARQQHPDKKEREEIAFLKAEVQRLQEELKKQRVHLSAECGRLRTHLASVECEKERLHTQLKKTQEEKEQIAKNLKIKEATILSLNTEKKQGPSKSTYPKKDVQVSANPKKISFKSSLKKGTNVKKTAQVPHSEARSTRTKEVDVKEQKSNQIKSVQFSQENQASVSESEKENEAVKGCNPDDVVEEIQHFDKVERILHSGEREFVYSSGTRKIISGDAATSQIFFYNGDVMITLSDKTEVYHFAESGTKQTCYPEGTVLLEYADGQEEKIYQNGMKQQKYKDGTVHVTYPDGTQEIRAPDGTLLKIQENGEELVEFTNGESELRTTDYKRREYLNGSSKTIYNDGRQETCYPNGRIRLKDKDGNVLMDTKYT